MVTYEVTVFTSNYAWSATIDHVYINLVGTKGKSQRTYMLGASSYIGSSSKLQVSHSTLTCKASIGELMLIELDKQPSIPFVQDAWFPAKVEVKSPEGKTYSFPIYTWINDSNVHRFREGTVLRACDDSNFDNRELKQELEQELQQELKQRQKDYCWNKYQEGLPHCMKADDACLLPYEVRFSFTKETEFKFTALTSLFQSKLKGLTTRKERWSSFYQISKVFSCRTTKIAEYVHEHWKDDDFFGYQFLNGVNPMMIRRCEALPSKFPVTDDMISLHGRGSLAEEMEKGNIFLCDYKILDDVKANVINGKQQYLMAPLVLLQKTPDDRMMPVAIQLKQKPGEDNPIFVPSDSKYDWLLAKIFVRSADFNVYELDTHLLRTHLLAEVFTVSLLRNVPMVHPLYKLLVPHTRYTLQINFLARQRLISEDGVFAQFTASGGKAMFEILSRALSSMTYRSLCIHDDIADRGLQDVPNFYYRDDGLRLWDKIHSFVKAILGHYYKNNGEVVKDTELQKWIKDIFEHGFLSQESSGIPQKFDTLNQLVKFVTMVIFTGSAQHAAVNTGQYDFGGWIPNSPSTLQRPPPIKKGETNEARILETLPDVNVTVQGMDTLWLLSSRSSDSVRLGQYPDDHFTEETPRKMIQDFQKDLEVLSERIQERNKKLDLPYKYLNPAKVENSVSI